MYASVIDKYEEPKKARITFQTKGIRSHVKVGNNIAEAWLEPIKNPVTGQVHRAIIEIPGGFEASRMDQASMKNLLQTTEINLISNIQEHMEASLKLGGKDHRN